MELLWGPWILEELDMIDGKGTQRHWKYPGPYSEQPAIDVDVYRAIRAKWVELTNEELKRQAAR
jgi:hypothetical protein